VRTVPFEIVLAELVAFLGVSGLVICTLDAITGAVLVAFGLRLAADRG
jgi:hypothetical protein